MQEEPGEQLHTEGPGTSLEAQWLRLCASTGEIKVSVKGKEKE